MPRRSNTSPAPPVMTWGRAAPILIVALVFDLIQLFFHFFWLAGPALAGLLCTLGVNSFVGETLANAGGKVVAGVCTLGAGYIGTVGIAVTTSIGVIMAFAVGLFGWAVVIMWMTMTNSRVFSEEAGNILRLIVGFIVDETPLIGALPALLVTTGRIYHVQIKNDKEKMKKWQAEHAAEVRRERDQHIAEVVQARATRLAEEGI